MQLGQREKGQRFLWQAIPVMAIVWDHLLYTQCTLAGRRGNTDVQNGSTILHPAESAESSSAVIYLFHCHGLQPCSNLSPTLLSTTLGGWAGRIATAKTMDEMELKNVTT